MIKELRELSELLRKRGSTVEASRVKLIVKKLAQISGDDLESSEFGIDMGGMANTKSDQAKRNGQFLVMALEDIANQDVDLEFYPTQFLGSIVRDFKVTGEYDHYKAMEKAQEILPKLVKYTIESACDIAIDMIRRDDSKSPVPSKSELCNLLAQNKNIEEEPQYGLFVDYISELQELVEERFDLDLDYMEPGSDMTHQIMEVDEACDLFVIDAVKAIALEIASLHDH